MRAPKPYANPYLAGIGIGAALLLALVVAGRGLGASGAFSTIAASSVQAVAPQHGSGNAFYADYALAKPWTDWLVLELIGVLLGAALSGWLARRIDLRIERGPRTGSRERIALAIGGGLLMGIGARLARGCTSGLGITGGALLSVGSWLFVLAAFAGAYLSAPMLRRAWR
ncbi:MAG TPA: YeeE/YedE thiosulfate transporter family protein [Longimicrobiales bacterium]|nr:YeeE/YedE thiosulfate transporter family protein [Longimicrobiales bacterium]